MEVHAPSLVVVYTMLGDMTIVTFRAYRIELTLGMSLTVVLSPEDISEPVLYDTIPAPYVSCDGEKGESDARFTRDVKDSTKYFRS